MAFIDELEREVNSIFIGKWETRDGRKVPEPEEIKLGNDAVRIKGTVLYADMAESTSLVSSYRDWFAAEIYKAYLVSACRLIRSNNGVITSFDGDRVMAVFYGDYKNSNAVKTGLMINYVVGNLINQTIPKKYPKTSYIVKQAVGIDTSDLFVARTGIRNNNDLVWVGNAANNAAKLCALREGHYTTFITEDVFNSISDETKYGGAPRQCMWEKDIWKEVGKAVYKSGWQWKP